MRSVVRSGNNSSYRRLLLLCVLALSASGASYASTINLGDTEQTRFEQIYLTLESASENTRRRRISVVEAPVDPAVFTRLRRVKSNGRESFSNATLIAGGDCYWIASTAGHSVLDQRFSRLANRADIEVELPDGSWVNPEEIAASPRLSWNSDEIDDWALLVLRAPRCQFNDTLRFASTLPYLPTQPLDRQVLDQCRRDVQFMCYHFDQGVSKGQRMLEENCELLSIERTEGHTGYASCKVDYGVSGCSPVCIRGDVWINLGVFSKGLKRHASDTFPQPVAGFRVMDGEIADVLRELKRKYKLN
ncbi:hypothetical protein [Litorivivens sp.]|uniref:hypothetical protein n=1 Tax=Litorivivens sp. TaxID=2020868 RepID=UPI0035697007